MRSNGIEYWMLSKIEINASKQKISDSMRKSRDRKTTYKVCSSTGWIKSKKKKKENTHNRKIKITTKME